MKLREDMVDLVAVDVGETEAAALELIAELGVVDAHEVEDGGLEVVDVSGVLVVVMLVGIDRRSVGANDL